MALEERKSNEKEEVKGSDTGQDGAKCDTVSQEDGAVFASVCSLILALSPSTVRLGPLD